MQETFRPKIELGFRQGMLTVMEATQERKGRYMVWRCTCDCGREIQLDTRTLQRGTICDCGCATKVKPGQKDITGQRFGRLVALEPTRERSSGGATLWRCRCDCGAECLAASTQLTQGYKKSCGCLGHPPLKDYVGKQFGQLTVKAYHGKVRGMHRWECLCDCGNTTLVGQTLLQTGKTKSCGCLQARIVTESIQIVDGTSVTFLEKAGSRLISSNSSGYNGVYFNRRTQKWVAQISFKRKTYYLGSFCKIEDAVKARKKAEDRIYGEFLEWYYDTYPDKRKSGR